MKLVKFLMLIGSGAFILQGLTCTQATPTGPHWHGLSLLPNIWPTLGIPGLGTLLGT